MKKIIIPIAILAAGFIGYKFFTRDKEDDLPSLNSKKSALLNFIDGGPDSIDAKIFFNQQVNEFSEAETDIIYDFMIIKGGDWTLLSADAAQRVREVNNKYGIFG